MRHITTIAKLNNMDEAIIRYQQRALEWALDWLDGNDLAYEHMLRWRQEAEEMERAYTGVAIGESE